MKNINIKSKKGFNLLEIMIVVLIMGILAGIAYPMYTKSINKARALEAINFLQIVQDKQGHHFTNKGSYITDISTLMPLSNSPEELKDDTLVINGKYYLTLSSTQPCATVAYKKNNVEIFHFVIGYETAGLACSGEVCNNFTKVLDDNEDAVCSGS